MLRQSAPHVRATPPLFTRAYFREYSDPFQLARVRRQPATDASDRFQAHCPQRRFLTQGSDLSDGRLNCRFERCDPSSDARYRRFGVTGFCGHQG